MTLRISQFPAALVATIALASIPAASAFAQAHSVPNQPANTPQSPFAGTVVEDIVARVNDQIITKSDYDRAMQDLEQQAHQQGWTDQQLEEEKKNLLRDLVDQQLLLSKGKQLGITGETEVIKQLDEIRKQNHLDSMEALENAAKEQGVSFEDFKEHIRDRIVTQQVIGQEVYRKVNISQAELQSYYDAHKEQFNTPETVRLSEILVPVASDDPAQVTAARSKADSIEAKLKAGDDFAALAKTDSSGPNAAEGGDLGQFKRGQLGKVIEDQTFDLKPGQYTAPIQTKQGFIVLKVTQHDPGGQKSLQDVMPQVEEAVGQQKMEPALRAYLKQLRSEAYIDYKPGYVDTAAVVNPSKPVYSAYAPPLPKKKKKIERTRFRQKTPRSAGQTETASAPAPNVPSLGQVPGAATATAAGNPAAAANGPAPSAPANSAEAGGSTGQVASGAEDQVAVSNPNTAAANNSAQAPSAAQAGPPTQPAAASSKTTQTASSQKPGKKEKIRFGQAPRETLPQVAPTQTVNAGGTPETQVAAAGDAPDIGQSQAAPEKEKTKTRFSDRLREPKDKKAKVKQPDPFAPPPITSEEVATQQVQSQPLGLAGDTADSKKSKPTEKTRLQDKLRQRNAPGPSAAPAGQPTSNQSTAPAEQQAPASSGGNTQPQ